jgi:phenylacetate-CoA ligase
VNRAFYNAVRGVVGSVAFTVAERLEGRELCGKHHALAADMSRPFAERRRLSWNRLVETVRFAAARVPYYRGLFADIGFDPESLARDPKYLADIPVLTKDIIRAQGERMLCDDHANYRKHISKTGGSTGPSAYVIYDQHGADWSSSVTRYARELVGAGSRRPQLHLAARFPERIPIKARMREQIKCLANNRFNVTFSSFAPDELDDILRRIRTIKPYLVHGHPSTFYQLALHVAEKGNYDRTFDVFESSGETLSAVQRDLISRVFGCTVINRYGLAETGVIAYQTDARHNGMVVFDPIAWPEIVDVEFGAELPQLPESRSGELVVSAFANKLMPLIRYRTGDLAALRETPEGFLIQKLIGRIHDIVKIAGIPVPTHHVQDVLDGIGGVREFQIENHSDRPVFRIVAEVDAATDTIQRKLRKLWSDSIDIEFVEFDALKLQGWRSKFRHLVTPSPVG